MVDIKKQYRTRNGLRVILHQNIPYNSVGDLVTYPIKGTVVTRETPLQQLYTIWTEDGQHILGKENKFDLIEIDMRGKTC